MCKYDPQREAEAAMKRAVAAEGADRQRLIRLALAWHELARDRRNQRTDWAHSSGDPTLIEVTSRLILCATRCD